MSENKKPAVKAARKLVTGKPPRSGKKPESKNPKSHPFVRTVVDVKTKILMSVSALPADDMKVKISRAAVFMHTLIGNTGYQENVEFENMKRALEYVADFGQVQANRFATAAIDFNKKNDSDLVARLSTIESNTAMTPKEPAGR